MSNNKVQEIDIDLNQFDHKYRLRGARADPDRTGRDGHALPSGATPLDLSKLAGLLGGRCSSGAGQARPT